MTGSILLNLLFNSFPLVLVYFAVIAAMVFVLKKIVNTH